MEREEEGVLATAQRRASVVWEGSLSEGSGTLTAQDSGVIEEAPVTFASRTEVPEGKTSPEELIAGALATCYAMSLSNLLVQKKDTSPQRLEVEAVCAFDDEQLKVTAVDLDVRAEVPGIDAGEFESVAQEAEQACPVANALRGNVEIRLQASTRGE
jgi:osmotically inducible protein OsmC